MEHNKTESTASTGPQRHTAVTACLKSKQLLLFAFAELGWEICEYGLLEKHH